MVEANTRIDQEITKKQTGVIETVKDLGRKAALAVQLTTASLTPTAGTGLGLGTAAIVTAMTVNSAEAQTLPKGSKLDLKQTSVVSKPITNFDFGNTALNPSQQRDEVNQARQDGKTQLDMGGSDEIESFSLVLNDLSDLSSLHPLLKKGPFSNTSGAIFSVSYTVLGETKIYNTIPVVRGGSTSAASLPFDVKELKQEFGGEANYNAALIANKIAQNKNVQSVDNIVKKYGEFLDYKDYCTAHEGYDKDHPSYTQEVARYAQLLGIIVGDQNKVGKLVAAMQNPETFSLFEKVEISVDATGKTTSKADPFTDFVSFQSHCESNPAFGGKVASGKKMILALCTEKSKSNDVFDGKAKNNIFNLCRALAQSAKKKAEYEQKMQKAKEELNNLIKAHREDRQYLIYVFNTSTEQFEIFDKKKHSNLRNYYFDAVIEGRVVTGFFAPKEVRDDIANNLSSQAGSRGGSTTTTNQEGAVANNNPNNYANLQAAIADTRQLYSHNATRIEGLEKYLRSQGVTNIIQSGGAKRKHQKPTNLAQIKENQQKGEKIKDVTRSGGTLTVIVGK